MIQIADPVITAMKTTAASKDQMGNRRLDGGVASLISSSAGCSIYAPTWPNVANGSLSPPIRLSSSFRHGKQLARNRCLRFLSPHRTGGMDRGRYRAVSDA